MVTDTAVMETVTGADREGNRWRRLAVNVRVVRGTGHGRGARGWMAVAVGILPRADRDLGPRRWVVEVVGVVRGRGVLGKRWWRAHRKHAVHGHTLGGHMI